MFLVTGGTQDEYSEYDSTEILDMVVGSWAVSGAKLPQEAMGLRAINFDNRVLIFGNDNSDSLFRVQSSYPIQASKYSWFHIIFIVGGVQCGGDNYDDILAYIPEDDTFHHVGHMIYGRFDHALSIVQAEDYLPWCHWGLNWQQCQC